MKQKNLLCKSLSGMGFGNSTTSAYVDTLIQDTLGRRYAGEDTRGIFHQLNSIKSQFWRRSGSCTLYKGGKTQVGFIKYSLT